MLNKNLCKFPSSDLVESIKITRFVFEQNSEVIFSPTNLANHRIILISQGEGTFFFENQIFPFNKGDLFFGFKNEECYILKGSNVSYLYIDFDGNRSEELFNRFEVNKINRKFSGFDSLIPLWNESLIRASANTIDLVAESMLLYTFSKIVINTSIKDSLINEIIKITNNEFKDCDLSISTLAKELGYNTKYLSHLFKSKVGMPFTKYLASLRINYAVSLFNYGVTSVKNVALLSGFNEQFYFSNVFKKLIGVSPKEYIKKN